MSLDLDKDAKKFIGDHYPDMSVSELADRFNVSKKDIENVIKKHNHNEESRQKVISGPKKIAFYAITISIPFIIFLGLEGILRVTNYMGNTDLFKEMELHNKTYMVPNPNFTARYFFYTDALPTSSNDAFLKEKPQDSFRIFTLGGSTAEGFPYGYNMTFSRMVRDVLQDAMPDRNVEIINVATSAINTYTLYDQSDEILKYDPDAIMIYSGHNEFYGAFGVGSNESMGRYPSLVRSYLDLQRIKTFLFFRSILVETVRWLNITFNDLAYDPASATLMERIVAERAIPLKGPKFDMAMNQFRSNMNEIINLYSENNIPVFIGSVISNLKDHKPFKSIESGHHPPAEEVYQNAKQILANGDSSEALGKFIYAKDLDALKFRAPSQINNIIKQLSNSTAAEYVPVKEEFLSHAESGIPGYDQFLEHLHPNTDGYYLLGKVFAKTMVQSGKIPLTKKDDINFKAYKKKRYITEFEEQIGYHRIKVLKKSWPFVEAGEQNKSDQDNYMPNNMADMLAYRYVKNDNLSWESAKQKLGQYYENQKEYSKALLQYKGLIRNQPWNDSPYLYAARLFVDQNKFEQAEPYLRKAHEINTERAYTNKMLGFIALKNGNPEEAIMLLETGRLKSPRDPQLLYNLSRAYGISNNYKKAQEILNTLKNVSPNFPGINQWQKRIDNVISSK